MQQGCVIFTIPVPKNGPPTNVNMLSSSMSLDMKRYFLNGDFGVFQHPPNCHAITHFSIQPPNHHPPPLLLNTAELWAVEIRPHAHVLDEPGSNTTAQGQARAQAVAAAAAAAAAAAMVVAAGQTNGMHTGGVPGAGGTTPLLNSHGDKARQQHGIAPASAAATAATSIASGTVTANGGTGAVAPRLQSTSSSTSTTNASQQLTTTGMWSGAAGTGVTFMSGMSGEQRSAGGGGGAAGSSSAMKPVASCPNIGSLGSAAAGQENRRSRRCVS